MTTTALPVVWRCGECGRILMKYRIQGEATLEAKCKCNSFNTLVVSESRTALDTKVGGLV